MIRGMAAGARPVSSAELGYRLGYAAFPLILLAGAAYLGWRMGRKRQPPRFVAWQVAAAEFEAGPALRSF